VSNSPNAYLLDSPGIMLPRIDVNENEKGLKLALVGSIRDSVVGEEIIADYLLFVLNRFKRFEYTNIFEMKEPSDNIEVVLNSIAKRIGAKNNDGLGSPNYLVAACYFISKYRQGILGKFTLDSLPYEK
jgi:ribosome biogenesis GTPase A